MNKIIVHMSCCCSFLYSIEVINLSYALSLELLLVTRRNRSCSEGITQIMGSISLLCLYTCVEILVYNALPVSTNLIESKDMLKKRTPDDQFSFLALMVLLTVIKEL